MRRRGALSFALSSVALSLTVLLGFSACSGAEFTGGDGSGGSGSGSTGTGGTTGVPPGGTVLCSSHADCDDQNPCSIDQCGVDGRCQYSEKCSGQKCCDGVCGQCCANEDCADELSCTDDTCFANFCSNVPDDSACAANQYCSLSEDCKDREPCPGGTADECDDGDPCTTDACQSGFCYHDFCSGGTQCCPGVGCATCCDDSQCADSDPCIDNVCVSGECMEAPHCSEGECCPSMDGAATCGACCRQDDCDDGVECTIDNCTIDGCSNVPNSELCGDGQVCDPDEGCVLAAQCETDAQCASTDPCVTGATCVNHRCEFTKCDAQGLQCCPGVGCRACCSNTDCGSQLCCPSTGTCQDCCQATDCLLIEANEAQAIPPIGDCQTASCEGGKCSYGSVICDSSTCCPPYGCMLECSSPF